MEQSTIITLLTDFGLQDVYVGVMKGAIAKINSDIRVIDLTHEIPRQNIAAGRFCLMNAYKYFPRGTIHLAVVDPGVGSERRGIAVQFREGYLVGPDNGLLSGVLGLSEVLMAVSLTNPKYWGTLNPSNTFHGRDIFAPVAAHLASGTPIQMLGEIIEPDSLETMPLSEPDLTNEGIEGCIQYVDIFGNLITNIPAPLVGGKNWLVKVRDVLIPQGNTYSDVAQGELVTLIGSHGWVEIAVNGGSARDKLALNWGDKLTLQFKVMSEGS